MAALNYVQLVIRVLLPLIWALLTWLMTYVPSVGFFFSLIPPLLVALVANGWQTALWLLIVYLVTTWIVQGVFQPKVTGNAVGVNATISLISLLLWAWVFGPIGALIALPCTQLVKALLVDADPKVRWVNSLISNETEVRGGQPDLTAAAYSAKPCLQRTPHGCVRLLSARGCKFVNVNPDMTTPAAAAAGSGAGMTHNVYQSLLANRIVFLGSEVRDENANAICAQMLLLNAEDPTKDIYLYINSPGGSVDSGMAIYDTMQWISNDVATVAMGLAASMGQFLLCAGAPGKRFALPHARILMHQPSGGLGGTASDIKIQAEQSLHLKQVMAELIAQHTGQTVEQITKDSDRDRWFTASEALSYGFIDHVFERASQIPGSDAPNQ